MTVCKKRDKHTRMGKVIYKEMMEQNSGSGHYDDGWQMVASRLPPRLYNFKTHEESRSISLLLFNSKQLVLRNNPQNVNQTPVHSVWVEIK